MERQWFLESISADGSHVTYDVTHLPFRVGRDPENDLVVATPGLSRHHALLTPDISGRIRLTDLNSTNGSFVNRRRIDGSCLLDENDIVHFGTAEFRLRMRQNDQARILSSSDMHTMLVPNGMELSELFVPNEAEFLDLLDGHGIGLRMAVRAQRADAFGEHDILENVALGGQVLDAAMDVSGMDVDVGDGFALHVDAEIHRLFEGHMQRPDRNREIAHYLPPV